MINRLIQSPLIKVLSLSLMLLLSGQAFTHEQNKIEGLQGFEELRKQGQQAVREGKYDQAKLFYRQNLAGANSTQAAWLMSDMGMLYYAQEKFEQAISQHEKALALDDSNEQFWFRIGIANIELAHYKKAEQNFITVLKMNSKHRDSWNDLGFVYNQLGQFKKAIVHFNKTIELTPDIANPYAHRAYSYLKMGEFEQASQDLSHSTHLNEKYNKNDFYWACLYASQGRKNKALYHLEQSIEKGFKWDTWIVKEESFISLRADTKFMELVKKSQAL